MSGAEQCPSDWLGIPCATDTGRDVQTDGSSCVDRICGKYLIPYKNYSFALWCVINICFTEGGTFTSLSGSVNHAPIYCKLIKNANSCFLIILIIFDICF